MLYRINNNTMLDLPKWKCRQEFADFYRARIESPNDVDLLRKLKDRCDAVEAKHKMKSERTRQRNIEFWAKPGAHERTNPQAVAIDVYDLKGRYIATYPSALKAAQALGKGKAQVTDIRKVAKGSRRQAWGYMFREHTPKRPKIKPYSRKIIDVKVMNKIAEQFKDYMTALPYKQYCEIRTRLCEHMGWSYWAYLRRLNGNTFITKASRDKIEEFFNTKIFE